MKNSLTNLTGPIGAVLFLLVLLLLLLFLPDPLRLTQGNTLAHNAPLILRHAPAPVMRHVRGVRHQSPHLPPASVH